MIKIRKVKNGYILKYDDGIERIYAKNEDLFSELIIHFEKRNKSCKGDLSEEIHFCIKK